jgi:serine/threonine protein kinase
MAIAVEIDASEAYAPLRHLEIAFGTLLGFLVAAVAAAIGSSWWAVRLRRLEARRIGPYTLEREIGEGGISRVYLARHSHLKRPVAVKVLKAALANDEMVTRFEREVQLCSRLSHPNTIEIYDYGRTRDGTFYYAMEYLDGVDLERLVGRLGPLPESRVIHILRQAAGSLGEAHAAGIVHRDVKPSNILLCRRGGVDDVVKVLDFGIAKTSSDSRLTTASMVLGTPEYMSPEMFDHADRVGASADVYSLGAVGYFLLTGTPVFEATTLAALCTAHLTERPRPPSERLGRPLDPTLEMAILGCLAKDKSARPRSVQDLVRVLDRSPVAHAWTADHAAAWWQAHASDVEALRPHDSVADAEAVKPTATTPA